MTTLLDILQQRFPDSSKTTLRQMLQSDRVRVNGSAERNAKREIGEDDDVEIAGSHDRSRLDSRVRILYEDDAIVVIDKAAKLLTIASANETNQTAEAILNAYYKAKPGESRVHVVHRLDRDSSGVLVFARTAWIRDRLQELFAAHDIERIYVAIVHGALTPAAGTFRSHLAEDTAMRVHSVSDPREGKRAVTHYRTVASGPRFSRLTLKLETGRRNQIRVHLSEAGHPIVGDAMYGAGLPDPLGRLALHATHLAFVDPRNGEKRSYTVPVPPEMEKLPL